MLYKKEILLRNNKKCIIRNLEEDDAQDFIIYGKTIATESNFLTNYLDEVPTDKEERKNLIQFINNSKANIVAAAFVDEKLVGTFGLTKILEKRKTNHRANLGISVIKDFWGNGIGSELMQACIECASEIGYLQIELEVVSDNQKAIGLYKKFGFEEFGRNPKGFKLENDSFQELILMRLDLQSFKLAHTSCLFL